jgi:hypothetical protein
MPRRGINAPIVVLAVPPSGALPESDPTVVTIYTWEAFPQFGGAPGRGNTVVHGKHSTREAPGVFFNILEAEPGEPITLRLGGQSYEYQVVSKCRVPVAGFEAVVRPKSAESLTIMTDNNQTDASFRIVLVAERRPNTLARDCTPGGVPL